MNESKKIAEKTIQDTELITTNKKSDVVMTYIKKKVLVGKKENNTPQKFDQSIKDDNNDEITNNL